MGDPVDASAGEPDARELVAGRRDYA